MGLITGFLKSFMIKSAVCFIKFQDIWQDLSILGRKIVPIMSLISSILQSHGEASIVIPRPSAGD